MLTGKNVGHIHITGKGREMQTLGREQRGMRRNRPYQLKGWRKFHAWKRHVAYPRPYRRLGISKMPTCFPTIARASGVTFQERKEREQIKISWDKMAVKLWGREAPTEATPFQPEGRRSTLERLPTAAYHRDDGGEGENRGFKEKNRELRKPDPIQAAGASAGRREQNTNTGSRSELQGSQPETF